MAATPSAPPSCARLVATRHVTPHLTRRYSRYRCAGVLREIGGHACHAPVEEALGARYATLKGQCDLCGFGAVDAAVAEVRAVCSQLLLGQGCSPECAATLLKMKRHPCYDGHASLDDAILAGTYGEPGAITLRKIDEEGRCDQLTACSDALVAPGVVEALHADTAHGVFDAGGGCNSDGPRRADGSSSDCNVMAPSADACDTLGRYKREGARTGCATVWAAALPDGLEQSVDTLCAGGCHRQQPVVLAFLAACAAPIAAMRAGGTLPAAGGGPHPPGRRLLASGGLAMGAECHSSIDHDSDIAICGSWCKAEYESDHCPWCKCKACDFCQQPTSSSSSAAAAASSGSAAVTSEASCSLDCQSSLAHLKASEVAARCALPSILPEMGAVEAACAADDAGLKCVKQFDHVVELCGLSMQARESARPHLPTSTSTPPLTPYSPHSPRVLRPSTSGSRRQSARRSAAVPSRCSRPCNVTTRSWR